MWYGELTGFWRLEEHRPLPEDVRGWQNSEPTTDPGEGGTRLDLGRLEVWLLRLSESHPSMLEAPAVQSAWDVFDRL